MSGDRHLKNNTPPMVNYNRQFWTYMSYTINLFDIPEKPPKILSKRPALQTYGRLLVSKTNRIKTVMAATTTHARSHPEPLQILGHYFCSPIGFQTTIF